MDYDKVGAFLVQVKFCTPDAAKTYSGAIQGYLQASGFTATEALMLVGGIAKAGSGPPVSAPIIAPPFTSPHVGMQPNVAPAAVPKLPIGKQQQV